MRVVSQWSPALSTGMGHPAYHYVDVYRSQQLDYVVVSEGSSLDSSLSQPSITNAAETVCPQLVEALGLSWMATRFIECYPATDGIDPTYDRIKLGDELTRMPVAAPGGSRRVVRTRAAPQWEPIVLDLALALNDMGLALSAYVGYFGVFELYGSGTRCRRVIGAYDGRRYYDTCGRLIEGHILAVVDEHGRTIAREWL